MEIAKVQCIYNCSMNYPVVHCIACMYLTGCVWCRNCQWSVLCLNLVSNKKIFPERKRRTRKKLTLLHKFHHHHNNILSVYITIFYYLGLKNQQTIPFCFLSLLLLSMITGYLGPWWLIFLNLSTIVALLLISLAARFLLSSVRRHFWVALWARPKTKWSQSRVYRIILAPVALTRQQIRTCFRFGLEYNCERSTFLLSQRYWIKND